MSDNPETCFVHHGIPIQISGYAADDHIYQAIAGSGTFYEIDLLEYMRVVLGRGNGCIIDVGGNIGNHSIYFGKFIADYVVAIEANPAVADILERNRCNLIRNLVPHSVYRLGLGAARGLASIELAPEHQHNIGAARLKLAGSETPPDAATIPVTTLDAMQGEIERLLDGRQIAAIKIDIEGMEPEVLRGGMGFLARHLPELFVETIDAEKLREVETLLRPLGYFRVLSRASTPVWHFSHRRNLSLSRLIRFGAFLFACRVSNARTRIARFIRARHRAKGQPT